MPPSTSYSLAAVKSPQPSGDLTIAHEPMTNLITVIGRGLWSLDYIQRHIQDFERILVQARKGVDTVRTLVDLRKAAVQIPEVATQLHQAISELYIPPERSAILVSSSLVAMQMRRGFNPETHSVFLSSEAALDWLDT